MAVTRIYQPKIGMRSSDMPGARIFRIETTISTASESAEISTKVTPSNQTSALTPGVYILELSGVYMNQPLLGATPAINATVRIVPPNK